MPAHAPRPPRIPRPWQVLMALALCVPISGLTRDYRVGSPRDAQQGNFCEDGDVADEIAALFEKFGAPTGFSALSASEACVLQVHSFTPRALHREIRIDLNDGGHYKVRFIRVELADGAQRILVTTRALAPPP